MNSGDEGTDWFVAYVVEKAEPAWRLAVSVRAAPGTLAGTQAWEVLRTLRPGE